MPSGSIEQETNQTTKFILRKEQHKAEILRALKFVMPHFSYNSSHDITGVFMTKLPDSNIAQNQNCGPHQALQSDLLWNCTIFQTLAHI